MSVECVVYQINASASLAGSGSSNELLSLLIRRMPHRADIAHKALIVTAGFPKYEVPTGLPMSVECVVYQGNMAAVGGTA
jgi:hypothetical protein